MIIELPCMDKVFGYIIGCVQRGEQMAPFMTLHALWGDPIHRDPAMCHKYGWFINELKKRLEKIGMRDIKVMEPRYHFNFRDIRFEAIK